MLLFTLCSLYHFYAEWRCSKLFHSHAQRDFWNGNIIKDTTTSSAATLPSNTVRKFFQLIFYTVQSKREILSCRVLMWFLNEILLVDYRCFCVGILLVSLTVSEQYVNLPAWKLLSKIVMNSVWWCLVIVTDIVGSGLASCQVHQPPATSICIPSITSFSRPSKCKQHHFLCTYCLFECFCFQLVDIKAE